MWRFRGSPYYLAKQAKRLGVATDLAHACRHNAEIFKLATLVSQLCEHWHRARKENGIPVFCAAELERLRGTLNRCELEVQKLHVLAASADEMLGEAWEAFDLERPRQTFAILEDFPTDILSLGDGTVGCVSDSSSVVTCEPGNFAELRTNDAAIDD